ncbi:hypothetical protein EJ06DRAFT_27765 [Trichodelitschia bisporula]|uniref:Uncharacterized protein n=1 Tax=Trichodelitschia bisporula TaxID=703511 RepID=A0A6G1IAZ8_9PEZI|nr:hypothetical protein EJ06DRAFT_27765 [Trichodelitschia bisporula]
MSTVQSEKTTFGVIIEKPATPDPATKRPQHLHLAHSKDNVLTGAPASPRSIPSTAGLEPMTPKSQLSARQPVAPEDADLHAKPVPRIYAHDLESQCHFAGSDHTKLSQERTKDCTMWPSRDALKAKAKENKRQRSFNPLRRLGKRQRLAVQIVIALVIIGAAVGIGVGVSRRVGGGVFESNGQSKPIPTN